MIPEKGKFYEIDYKDNEDDEMSYNGLAMYTGEETTDDNLNTYYVFDIPDNVLQAWFVDKDIIRETNLTFTPIQLFKNNA
jgi:hypothetical protein